jgi:hypothetical protein
MICGTASAQTAVVSATVKDANNYTCSGGVASAGINSGACATVVTSTAANALTTDAVLWSFSTAPTTADGSLNYTWYLTAGNVNWKVCNGTAGTLTPSGLTINWRVIR